MCVSVPMCVSHGSFSSVCSMLFQFVFILSYYFYVPVCFLKRKKDCKFEWERKRVGSGKGSCNQNILYKKYIYVKIKRE